MVHNFFRNESEHIEAVLCRQAASLCEERTYVAVYCNGQSFDGIGP